MNGQAAGHLESRRAATASSTRSTPSTPSTCLRVASTNPANGATVTVAPSAITVTFNKPVSFSTLSAADLTFTSAPAGVTVNVGAPIAVDNPNFPTDRPVPDQLHQAGRHAGQRELHLLDPEPAGRSGRLQGRQGPRPVRRRSRSRSPTSTAPVVTGTTLNGRTVQIQFSKALDPATVTLQNIFVLRKGSRADLAADGDRSTRATSTSTATRARRSATDRNQPQHRPADYTVTLNYSGLPQTELPSDKYAIVVLSQERHEPPA